MTGRRTSRPNTGVWTATIILLLFSASGRSQSAPALNEAAPSPFSTATSSPSGSITSLRKIDSIVEAASTTLKSVSESPGASLDAVVLGEKISVDNSTNNRLDELQAHNEPAAKSEKLEAQKVAEIEENDEVSGSLREFNEKEDSSDVHDLEEDNDREPTTPPSKKGINNNNKTPVNTKEKDDKSTPKFGISLVNDTNVNFNGKTPVKDSKEDAILENESKALENATNVIASGDAGDTLEKRKGPKAQVEIVKNSTVPKIERIIDHADETGEERKEIESFDANKRGNNNEVLTTVIPDAKDSASVKTKTDSLTVLSEAKVETEKTENGKTLASPRGRTISFGGTNEFITAENKTRQNDGITDQPIANDLTKEIFQEHKSSEFKPYPYVKTTTNYPSNGSEARLPLSGNREVPESTEEASALENTIGQRQQDKKFVVTEPSVVIDNSIQQFKSTYYKRSGNASRIQSTVDLTSSTTASSLESSEKETTISGPSTKSITLENSTPNYVANLRVSSTENDVPRGKDEETKTSVGVGATSSGLHLTGNGITEVIVGMKNHSVGSINDAEVTEASIESTMSIIRATDNIQVQNSTEVITTLRDEPGVTNMDIQTDTENSMLKISPFKVTEDSTRIPSNESSTSFGTSTTIMPTTTSMLSSSSSSTELEHLVTTITSEVSTDFLTRGILQSDEPSTVDGSVKTTTSKIEYEFVGLTESTVSQKYIATSESSNAVRVDKDVASSTLSSFSEFLTASTPASITESVTTLSASTIDTIATKKSTTNEETSTEAVTLITESSTVEDSTTSISTLDFSNSDEATTSINDNFDLTTMEDDLSTTDMNESLITTTDEISVVTSATNVPEISSNGSRNTTDTGRAAGSSSTSIPDTSDTPSVISENSAGASIASTESTIPLISTEPPQVIIETTKRPDVEPISIIPSTEPMTTLEPEISSTPQEAVNNVTAIPTTVRGAIPSLVRIVFEGNWADVCPHLPALRQSLAELLTSGLGRTVLAIQIIYQKNPCTDGYAASSTESSGTSLLLYVVDQKGNFDEEMTKMLPALYSKSPIKLQVTIHSFQLVQDSDSGNAIAVVVVSCVAFICLVLLAGLLFIMRKRQTRFNYGERCRPVSLDAYSLDSVSAYNSVRRKGAARASKRSYGNPTFEDSSAIPSHPLNFGGLATFCNEQNAISEEFSGIPQVTARIDELPPGAEVKNRYANVVPLPETRVSLMKINNDPLTEYINASYVRGPKNATKYYIACQAPIESTVTDFWRMIWEQQSKVIIMLTDLVENGVEKCAEYIPPSEVTDCHRLFGDFQVTLKKRETKEKYAISTLHLKNLENNTFREISHIWYLWPANGVQSDAAGLIAVLLEARALQRGGPGPIVVHCSPGTGRTGTLIALDLGIRQYEITRTIDVPRVVYTIRRDRAGAVQTKEQYAFIYKALNLYATKLAGGALES